MNDVQNITLDSLKNISIEEFLNLLQQQSAIAVQFPNGESLVVQVKPKLATLPPLTGYVPLGWKDAIYEY